MNTICHTLYIIHKLDFAIIVLLTKQCFTLSFKISDALPIHYSTPYSQYNPFNRLFELGFLDESIDVSFKRRLIIIEVAFFITDYLTVFLKQP